MCVRVRRKCSRKEVHFNLNSLHILVLTVCNADVKCGWMQFHFLKDNTNR